MILQTPRLTLREMVPDDWAALSKVLSDAENMRHYPHALSGEEVRGWIERNMGRYRVFGFGLWAACLNDTGEVIGDCGLTMQLINGQIRPEIGYHIRRDLQRQGYAREAAAAVRDWTFTHTPFNMVCSYMKDTNIPSGRTAMSYGARLTDEYVDPVYQRMKVYALTREQWKEIRQK